MDGLAEAEVGAETVASERRTDEAAPPRGEGVPHVSHSCVALLYIHVSIHLSIYTSIYTSIYLYIYLSASRVVGTRRYSCRYLQVSSPAWGVT